MPPGVPPASTGVRRTCPECGASHKRVTSEKCRKCDPPPPRSRPGGSRRKQERRRVVEQLLGQGDMVWRSLDIRDPEQLREAINETLGKALTVQDRLYGAFMRLRPEEYRFTDDKGAEQLRGEVRLIAEQVERTGKILNDAVGKRLEAARIAIQARHAELITNVILQVVENPALKLSPAQKTLFRQFAAEQLLSHASDNSHALLPETQDSGRGG